MKVVIVEDEIIAAQTLQRLIMEIRSDFQNFTNGGGLYRMVQFQFCARPGVYGYSSGGRFFFFHL